MSLQAALFRGDTKLEAAAVSDPAHILPGARGPHVRKIQLALNQLDAARLDLDGIYGRDTAAAVLAYKQQRSIINPSYQTKPDNIVGKKTMTALDQEMFLDELKPVLLQTVLPGPSTPTVSRGGLRLAFAFGDRVASGSPVGAPASLQPLVQVIIPQAGGLGTIRVVSGQGGKLQRTQVPTTDSENPFQVAKLRNARPLTGKNEEAEVVDDPQLFTFDALNCGQTFFQVTGFASPTKRSAVLRLLVLAPSAGPTNDPDDLTPSGVAGGLVSVSGTPLTPLDGRKINLFGEEEALGFEDFGSDINHCTATRSRGRKSGLIHRPWTDDPRKPTVGLSPKSVKNICSRGSPIKPVTIDEIKRIGMPGCRVTYAEAGSNPKTGAFDNVNALRRAFVDAGLARRIDEGAHAPGGRAIVFELI